MPVSPFFGENSERSFMLARSYRLDSIPPLEVIEILAAAKIGSVLVGTYGLERWLNNAGGTEMVEILVNRRQLKHAVVLLAQTFSHLRVMNAPLVVSFRHRKSNRIALRVIKPVQQPYAGVLHNSVKVGTGGSRCRVPSLEMAIVLTFASMTSLYRSEEGKHQDAHDFICLIKQNSDYSPRKLAELGELIYRGAGKTVLKFADMALTGKPLII